VVVFGLGLIGLVTVQLLRASGCSALGVDINSERLALARQFGAETVDAGAGGDPVAAARAWTSGKGVDGVLITASAKNDEIVHQAAEMCRKRGRIVLVGVVGLNLRRSDFYEKELTFQVSCSYGPGRYDQAYEQAGHDYPYGLVRWTEQRNFEAVLEALRSGQLDVTPLLSHRFPLASAPEAYRVVSSDKSALGVLLHYPEAPDRSPWIQVSTEAAAIPVDRPVVAVIGAGNFSKMTLMPALAKSAARIATIADIKGEAAQHLAAKFGAETAGTDYKLALRDPGVDAVLIAVGHSLHARMVCEALEAGKHVFVEKPLAMTADELKQVIETAGRYSGRHVTVGFNRRFSPHTQRLLTLLRGRSEPLAMTFTANAGTIPPEHWVHDPVRGGGRIVGEACHYIDLMVCLTGSRVRAVSAAMMGTGVAVKEDKMSITLGFEDGSVGTVSYFGNGSKAYPKEQLEVFSEGRVFRIDNFRRTTGHGVTGFRRFATRSQDKGHVAQFAAFVDRLREGGEPLIPLDQLVNVTLASFAAMTAARESRTIVLDDEYGDLTR